jgi:hypothetical protein
MSDKPTVYFDPDYGLAKFSGPGGFAQCTMPKRSAENIARALGLLFVVKRVGVKP